MQHCFISGVSRGLGRAYAEKFLDAGWQVSGTTTSGNTPFTHDNLRVYALDLAEPEQIKAICTKLKAAKDTFDIVIDNAGVNISSRTERRTSKLSIETLQQTLAINLVGTVDLTEQLLPQLRADAQIIIISSGAGAFHPFIDTGGPSYQIAKAALNMYAKTLAARLEKTDTNVWAYDPGWVKTDMGSQYAPKKPATAAAELYELTTTIKPKSGTFWSGEGERDW